MLKFCMWFDNDQQRVVVWVVVVVGIVVVVGVVVGEG